MGAGLPSSPVRTSRSHLPAPTFRPDRRNRASLRMSPPSPSEPLSGKTIVVTGVTGQVAEPVAVALAEHNEVIGAARFKDAAARDRLEEAGVRCVPIDLAHRETWAACPPTPTTSFNFAVSKSNDWDRDLRANSGGLAWLMEHHQRGHRPSSTVRPPASTSPWAITSSPRRTSSGDNHGVWPFLRTYSICKIAAEATARWAAERFGLPTTVARLSVPYGDRGGWPAIHLEMMLNGSEIPVHVDAPSVYHPLHQDDIIAMIPALLGAAAVPATTVNWGGDQAVSIEEWCGYLSRADRGARPLRSHPGHHRQRADRPDPNAPAGRDHRRRTGGRACSGWSPPATPSCWPDSGPGSGRGPPACSRRSPPTTPW